MEIGVNGRIGMLVVNLVMEEAKVGVVFAIIH